MVSFHYEICRSKPVYKKENNLKRDNYRPVSILTVISKLYETVLNSQVVDHFYALFNELSESPIAVKPYWSNLSKT